MTLSSVTTGDSETVTLTETNNNSGVFKNLSSGVMTADSSTATAEDGVLQFIGGEDLMVSYTDPQDSADMISANLQRAPIVWDGGGSDENWTTAENWVGDVVPTKFDSVLFNSTSTKDCNFDITTIEVVDFTVAVQIIPVRWGIISDD